MIMVIPIVKLGQKDTKKNRWFSRQVVQFCVSEILWLWNTHRSAIYNFLTSNLNSKKILHQPNNPNGCCTTSDTTVGL